MPQKESEFGKGFTYCIGLFLAHSERRIKGDLSDWVWFNGASDHLYELEIPDNFPLKKECKAWRDKCLEWGHGSSMSVNKKDARQWALAQALKFLRAWDEYQLIETIKGRYE
jgi:hypothetical protein